MRGLEIQVNQYYRKSFLLFLFFLLSNGLFSQQQVHCGEIEPLLDSIDKKMDKINMHDPDFIPLHYFFMEDIERELADFVDNILPKVSQCPGLSYYQIANKYDNISFRARNKKDTLVILQKRIDSLFYVRAYDELMVDKIEDAKYFLDRSLQYNSLYTKSLLLKLHIDFSEEKYEDCVVLIHKLYNEAELNREQEMEMADFTAVFYKRLYEIGDSLMKEGNASNSLEIFKVLESFCQNMPSAYCNDDYYHGIMRSKTGVYNSYITIARVALQRNNHEIAEKFLEYARLYKEENPDQILPELELDISVVSAQKSLTEIDKVIIKDYKIHIEYKQLIVKGMENYMQKRTEEAYTFLSQAKKLEDCNCFARDPRVDALLNKIDEMRTED